MNTEGNARGENFFLLDGNVAAYAKHQMSLKHDNLVPFHKELEKEYYPSKLVKGVY